MDFAGLGRIYRYGDCNSVAVSVPDLAAAQTTTPHINGTVAAPRHYDMLRAPALTGGDVVPARRGALDYAAIPSLINGKRVPRRTGRCAP